MYETRVIRISINYDNISFCVRLILRGKLGSFNKLYFLLAAAVNSENRAAAPAQILKIIIFINSRKDVMIVVTYLQNTLLQKIKTELISD